MRKLMLVLLVLVVAALAPNAGRVHAADTGTYRILSYEVLLTPHSDGAVAIEYYQKWHVTGGHIPWITVGTANGNFAIERYHGAVSEARSASEGGWSGVRLDLDRDYQPGETFEVSFSILQRGLFYSDQQSYRLDFTPGWYDRAAIDSLSVAVKFFASLATVTANPAPSSTTDDEMIWDTYGLGPGGHFTIHVSFPIGLFPAGIAKGNLRGSSGAGGAPVVLAIIIFIVVIVIIISALSSSSRRYSGGRIFYGGIFGGGSGGGRSGGGGRSSGGGGGFGGASMSCACACVSCACACACAGGGGAGCARKLEHTCPVCERRRS